MIVEDDEKIRKIVSETIRKWQYEVIEVTKFDQIRLEVENTQPHL